MRDHSTEPSAKNLEPKILRLIKSGACSTSPELEKATGANAFSIRVAIKSLRESDRIHVAKKVGNDPYRYAIGPAPKEANENHKETALDLYTERVIMRSIWIHGPLSINTIVELTGLPHSATEKSALRMQAVGRLAPSVSEMAEVFSIL